jgi:hypothetical protein
MGEALLRCGRAGRIYAGWGPGGQVTAYGNNSAQCKVERWTPAVGIHVLCFRSGRPFDTRFDVSFAGPFLIG